MDSPAKIGNKFLNNAQTKPGPSIFGGKERFKNFSLILLADTGTIVFHFNFNPVLIIFSSMLPGSDEDLAIGRNGLEGIQQ